MAHIKPTLQEQIKIQQDVVWSLAEKCSSDHMKLKDRVFEQGLVVEETKYLKAMFDDESDEIKKEYLLVLTEMKKFYSRIVKSQQGLVS